MTSETMWDAIYNRHGDTAFSLAVALNIKYHQILKKWKQRIGEQDDLMKMVGEPPLTMDDVADAAYWEIVKTCRAKYFGEMSRETALAVSSSFVGDAYLYLAEDLQINHRNFVCKWNSAHPDEPEIW